jgi:hypothetical protein
MKRRSKVSARVVKAQRPKSAPPKRQNAPKDSSRGASRAAGEDGEIARLNRELNEAREQLTASSELLQIVSSSPGDLQPVFEAMLERAVRICDATFGNIYRWDGELLHLLAAYNTPPALAEFRRRSALRPALIRRMVETKRATHIVDVRADPEYAERRTPSTVAAVELGGGTIVSKRSDGEGKRIDRFVFPLSPGSSAFHRKADRLSHELRRPGRHCH